MEKTRLEAFSDGVIAIIITIMILELKIPHTASWDALKELAPQLLGYVLSFVFVGIYWGNHHHMLTVVKHVNGSMIWANLNLLFWLSLIPFATGWMDENHFATNPVVVYAILLNLCGIAYTTLQFIIMRSHHFEGAMQHAMNRMARKGIFSMVCYGLAIPFAFLHTGISCALFVTVAVVWLMPERSIEQALNKE